MIQTLVCARKINDDSHTTETMENTHDNHFLKLGF